MNRRLSESYERIQEIEQRITQLEQQGPENGQISEYQRKLIDLHREAQQISQQPVIGANAHLIGIILGGVLGFTVFIILRKRERKKTR